MGNTHDGLAGGPPPVEQVAWDVFATGMRGVETELGRLRENALGVANTAAALVDRVDELRREVTGEPKREYGIRLGAER